MLVIITPAILGVSLIPFTKAVQNVSFFVLFYFVVSQPINISPPHPLSDLFSLSLSLPHCRHIRVPGCVTCCSALYSQTWLLSEAHSLELVLYWIERMHALCVFLLNKCAHVCACVWLWMHMPVTADGAHASEISLAVWPQGKAWMFS